MTEEWRPINGTDGNYEVSDHGRVRRAKPGSGTYAGRILTLVADPKGYLVAQFRRRGKHGGFKVARLVAEAFHGPCPAGYQCNHIDGVKTNNVPANLEWVTPKENMRHAYATGLKVAPVGEEHPSTKLTDAQVAEIRSLAGTETMVETAQRFGVSAVHVLRLQRGDLRSAAAVLQPISHPRCSGCGASLPWAGQGRRPSRCRSCKGADKAEAQRLRRAKRRTAA